MGYCDPQHMSICLSIHTFCQYNISLKNRRMVVYYLMNPLVGGWPSDAYLREVTMTIFGV